MTSNLLGLLAGFFAASALIVIVMAFRPITPDLADTIARLHRPPTRNPGQTDTAAGDQPADRFGRWVMARTRGLPGLTAPYADLDLLDMTPARFYAWKAAWAMIGLALPSLLGLFLNFIGMTVPLTIPAAASLAFAALGWIFPSIAIRRDAINARERFARSITSYIDLVVLERLGGAGVASAISDPARIASAPLFVRIREALDRYRIERKAPWTALGLLAEAINLPQLADLADTMELSGTKSTPITDSLQAKARDIRNSFLTLDTEKAHAASQKQTGATALLLACFIAFLMTPALLRLLNS